jgi:hypothetical protein
MRQAIGHDLPNHARIRPHHDDSISEKYRLFD